MSRVAATEAVIRPRWPIDHPAARLSRDDANSCCRLQRRDSRSVGLPLLQPERVDRHAMEDANTPKVPAVSRRSVSRPGSPFGKVMGAVPVSSTEAAELTKLLENTFRAVNIALVNKWRRSTIPAWTSVIIATKPSARSHRARGGATHARIVSGNEELNDKTRLVTGGE